MTGYKAKSESSKSSGSLNATPFPAAMSHNSRQLFSSNNIETIRLFFPARDLVLKFFIIRRPATDNDATMTTSATKFSIIIYFGIAKIYKSPLSAHTERGSIVTFFFFFKLT